MACYSEHREESECINQRFSDPSRCWMTLCIRLRKKQKREGKIKKRLHILGKTLQQL